MGADTKIEWADDTVNAWWGCTKVSPGCAHCYADGMGARFGVQWGDTAERRLRVEAAIRELVRIANRGDREGRPRRVFMQSMSDLFEDRADLRDPRARVFGALQAINQDRVRLIPMLLTKRAEHMVHEVRRLGLPRGAWVGVSVESQAEADKRIRHLLRVAEASVRFLSCEPLLGAVDVARYLRRRVVKPWETLTDRMAWEGWSHPGGDGDHPGLQWVIGGGESGLGARPMHPAWARSLRDQCAEAGGAPFFFKQWGEWGPDDSRLDPDGRDPWAWEYLTLEGDRVMNAGRPGSVRVRKFGKRAAGRLLDGREWSEVPDAG